MIIERFHIGDIAISKTNLKNTLDVIDNALKDKKLGYICVTNARTTYLANHDTSYCKIQNKSLLTVPDGMPLIWIAHNMLHMEVDRVSGPDLMNAIFNISDKKKYSHFFYGSTINSIFQMQLNLKKTYPDIIIKGAISPPFQTLEEFNIAGLAILLNELKPTFFWCGLGAPKQEKFIALLQPMLKNTICIGVGLAFEYYAGTVKRAPSWMRRIGLEGFVRLVQQPERINLLLVKRYIYTLKIILFTFLHLKNYGKTSRI